MAEKVKKQKVKSEKIKKESSNKISKWFKECKSEIKKVIIEEGLTNIGRYAFWGCNNF